MVKRHGSAVWQGGIRDGSGTISTESGALTDYPYGFASRFEDKKGSNPEELLGAAHAACFTMALSLMLGEAGHTAERLETKAVVAIDKDDGGFVIPTVALSLEARIPGIGDADFQRIAATAKEHCPVSKLFNASISLDARLV